MPRFFIFLLLQILITSHLLASNEDEILFNKEDSLTKKKQKMEKIITPSIKEEELARFTVTKGRIDYCKEKEENLYFHIEYFLKHPEVFIKFPQKITTFSLSKVNFDEGKNLVPYSPKVLERISFYNGIDYLIQNCTLYKNNGDFLIQFDDDEIDILSDRLKEKNVDTLWVQFCHFSGDCSKNLAKILNTNSSLHTLHIFYNDTFNDDAMESLYPSLIKTSLKRLFIRGNKLTDKSARTIAQIVKSLDLEELTIDEYGLSPKDATIILEALQDSTSLIEFCVSAYREEDECDFFYTSLYRKIEARVDQNRKNLVKTVQEEWGVNDNKRKDEDITEIVKEDNG